MNFKNIKIKLLLVYSSIILLVAVSGLTACSTISQVGKSARNLTSFGGNSATDIDRSP